MKKKMLFIVSIVFMLSVFVGSTALASSNRIQEFARLKYDGEKVWTVGECWDGMPFAYGNVEVRQLPYGMQNQGKIYKFCFYNGRIYYLTGQADYDAPEKIYSCNAWGGDNVLIADGVSPYSFVYIVDNCLYYSAYESSIYTEYKGYTGGIYKINLGNYSWQCLSTGGTYLLYCDGEYVYFDTYDGNCYIMDTNGNNVQWSNGHLDEFRQSYYKICGDYVYYERGSSIYRKLKDIEVTGSYFMSSGISSDDYFIIEDVRENYVVYYVPIYGYYGNSAKVYVKKF